MSRFDDNQIDGDALRNSDLVHAPRSVNTDRGRGALVGLAVGDALGTTLEFQRISARPFSPLLDGPHRAVTGGGPFNLAAGQVTDDTQMAVALTVSMMQRGGFEAAKVGAAYVAWATHAFDIGNQTSEALGHIAAGREPQTAGRAVWIDGGKRAAGNGSLMRTTPIALFHQDDPARRREVSMADSALTHFDPRCQLACAAFNGAIAAALGDDAPTSASMFAAARSELSLATAELSALESAFELDILAAHRQLEQDLDAAVQADPKLYGGDVDLEQMAGFVRVAFRLAFWQLMHAPSFEAALIDVVNRGGDADTNGAITGALLGARFGEAGIPAAWRETVDRALHGEQGIWATTYHPRRLFALVR
jgi:ADP-ribosyl-[dinitrogen reductase] hydrolase